MRVLADTINERVDREQYRQHSGEHALHDDEDQPRDGLGRLIDAEFLHERQDADDGDDADDLDEYVDPDAAFALERPGPEEEGEHECLDDELAGGLD